MSVIKIESVEQYKEIAKDAVLPICIDFSATWCGPCRMIGPKFEIMAGEFAGKFIALKIDVDDLIELAQEFSVNAMPTFVIVKKGVKVEELVGADESKLKALIVKHI